MSNLWWQTQRRRLLDLEDTTMSKLEELKKIFSVVKQGDRASNAIPPKEIPSLLEQEGKVQGPSRADYFCSLIDLYLQKKIDYKTMHSLQSNNKGNMSLLKTMGLIQ